LPVKEGNTSNAYEEKYVELSELKSTEGGLRHFPMCAAGTYIGTTHRLFPLKVQNIRRSFAWQTLTRGELAVFCCEARPGGKRGRKGGVVKYVRDGDEHSVEERRK
jgi:hypothetical protein